MTDTAAPRWAAAMMCFALFAGEARAQQPEETLSLDRAISIAVLNNPDHLSVRNNENAAAWGVRAAYGAFLPRADVFTGFNYQGAGDNRVGGVSLGETPSFLISDYTLALRMGISGATLYGVGEARANQRATAAETNASRFQLVATVAQQYIAALRARDGLDLARQELARAEQNLALADARVEVGAAIPLERMQADVDRGRAEVEVERAANLLKTEKLRLGQQLGVELDLDTELTTSFAVFDPDWTADQLVSWATDGNPSLRAVRARHDASRKTLRSAQSGYLPSLDFSLRWSGFAREATDPASLISDARNSAANNRESCLLFNAISDGLTAPLNGFPLDCTGLAFTPSDEQALRSANDVFPFDYTSQPLEARFQVSLPLFQGFAQKQRVEQAQANARDAQNRVRAQELQLRTDIVSAHEGLLTARRIVAIEEQNRDQAAEQLRLERERYRLGATSFVDLLNAETLRAQADRNYLNALYDFHASLATLEAAVGRPLAAPTN
ncbi:MAG TPA: TolC family protein [Longimicrobiales bacterium]|nr:TolC family protein [Longimicrobiales bacterium]